MTSFNLGTHEKYRAQKYFTRWKDNARCVKNHRESIKNWTTKPVVTMINLEPLDIKKALYKIQEPLHDYFDYVSFPTFLNNLNASWHAAYKNLKGKDYTLSFLEEDTPFNSHHNKKSEHWIAGLLLKHNPSF